MTNLDLKQEEFHLEDIKAEAELSNAPVLKSDLDQLTAWQTVRRFWKAVLLCNLLSFAAAADGYQINLNGNIIANLGFVEHIGQMNPTTGAYALTSSSTALWGALQSLGQIVGMVLLNPVSDKIGRKMTLYLLWCILFGSIMIETFVHNWQQWAGAKLLAGVGIGCLQATLPIYVTEWAPVNIRGGMLLAYSCWNQTGGFLAPLILFICQKTLGAEEWKIPILSQWAFLGIMFPIFIWLPETPSYYAARGLHDQGKAVLRRVNGNVEGYNIDAEYQVIRNTIEDEQEHMTALGEDDQSWRSIVKSYGECFKGTNLKRTLAASLPASCQQLTGLAFLSGYASLFFREAGFSNAFEITSILFAVKIAMVFVFTFTTDRMGRRTVVIVLGGICCLTLLIIGILGHIEHTNSTNIALIVIACIWSGSNVGLGAFGWSFAGEVATQKLRARTSGLGSGIAVIFGLTFNTSVPIMLLDSGARLGGNTYNTAFVFLGFGTICWLLTILLLPEVAKRNSAEMDEMYEKNVPPWKMKGYVTDVQKAHVARPEQAL
ncbi:sugar transporter [Cryptococcus wingfieldii CBS 7118]|uniref:Sugar transporter n=1 Tax=Cryptococcus wingfieldii CBS 7118 TaxID=1295528 RepID=A0A1E3IYR2_9TREE|nr:sugar transporter [Cryptococcus wingfieldii CBS 7118]ODN93565.1 sugar transporter [Cryptococcus wingfieldii CBS 7118]